VVRRTRGTATLKYPRASSAAGETKSMAPIGAQAVAKICEKCIGGSRTVGNDYMIGIASRFARMIGWTEAQIAALRKGMGFFGFLFSSLPGTVRQILKLSRLAGWNRLRARSLRADSPSR
jgi:hypothetical protein